jgi:hypothetical protein
MFFLWTQINNGKVFVKIDLVVHKLLQWVLDPRRIGLVISTSDSGSGVAGSSPDRHYTHHCV